MARTPWGEMAVTALLVAFLFQPSLATTVGGWIEPLLAVFPENWTSWSTYSLGIIGAGIGALIGYIIYRT